MTSMEQWQTTAASYAVLGAVCYGAYRYYYYSSDNNRRPQVQRNALPRQADILPKSDNKSTRGKQREDKQKAGPKKPKQQETAPGANVTTATSVRDGDERDDLDAFVAGMTKAQKGTDFKTKGSQQPRIKTVKPAAANKTSEVSAASSSTGADVGEQTTSGAAPTLEASDAEAGPISLEDDMGVEKPKTHASISITPSTQPSRPSQPKKQSPSQDVETKKQRQNKKKAEEARLAREELEKVRKADMEKHRREARIAEGRPAKDGTASGTATYKPATNAWDSTAAPAVQAPSQDAPLLDTMSTDPNGFGTTVNINGVNGTNHTSGRTTHSGNKVNGTVSDPKSSYNDLPSEEEQMRMLKEQDDSWTTVAKPKKGKKKQNGIAGGSESGDAAEAT